MEKSNNPSLGDRPGVGDYTKLMDKPFIVKQAEKEEAAAALQIQQQQAQEQRRDSFDVV